jgi:hypothetical protein
LTNRQKYIIDGDDDGHWFYFPVEKREDFEKWIDIQYGEEYDDPLYGNYPDWLKCIDGPHFITFENPEDN